MQQSARIRSPLLVLLASAALATWLGVPTRIISAEAAAVGSPAVPARTSAARRPDDGIRMMTPAREAAAMTFARRHHPELTELLERLKGGNRRQYDQAILELFRTSERLARIEERDPERYEMTLELWKLDSRIQLRAARMAMSADPELEAELKVLLIERHEWKVRQMTLDRDRTQARLERLDKNIAAAQKAPERAAEKELQRLKRTIGAAAANRKQNVARKGRKAAKDRPSPQPRRTKQPRRTDASD